MPRYMGDEFYEKAISEKMTTLSNRIFHVPQSLPYHFDDCCILPVNVLNLSEDLKNILPDRNVADTEDLRNLIKVICTKENLLKNSLSISGYQEEDELEIIPSSDPNSDGTCSFTLDLSHENEEYYHNFSYPPTINVNLFVKYHPFEVPQFPDELQLTFNRLPDCFTLAKRMKILELYDPLVKNDGTNWTVEDFLKYDDYFDAAIKVSLKDHSQTPLETSSLCTIENLKKDFNLQDSLETVIFPTSHGDVFEALQLSAFTLADDFFASSNEEALITLMKERVIDTNFVVCLENKSCLPDTNTTSFSDLSRVGDDLVIEFLTQPILSFTLLENQYAGNIDISSECLQNLYYEKDISLLPSSFLSQDTLLNLNRKVWDCEKYYDGMQISVPFISPVMLPDVINEASEILNISELDIGIINECLSWNIHFPDVLSLSSCLSVLSDNIYICEPGPSECVEKIPIFDLDFMWNDEVKNNETDEDILSALQHTVYDDSNNKFIDPLESFIHVRFKQKLTGKSGQMNSSKDSTQPAQSIITPLVPNDINSSKTKGSIKTITINITDDFEQVLKYIQDYTKVYIDVLKKSEVLTTNDTFFEISVDKIQFLLKEYEMQKSETDKSYFPQKLDEISIIQSLQILHIMKIATELLIHSCLETCISWITSQKEGNLFNSSSSLSEMCHQLLDYQCDFHQKDILHPKLSTLCCEIGKFITHHLGSKVLIVVPREFPKLLSVIQHVLSKNLHLTVNVITDLKSFNLNSRDDSIYVAPYSECHIHHLSFISLIVVYDERVGAYFRNLCKDNDIAYLDLITQYNPTVNLVKSNEYGKEFTASFTVICSTCVTQYRQLVYLLEARYNILVIERDYETLSSEDNIYFADIILGVSHCIVLLSLQDFNRQFDLEGSAKRFVALGMQFSYCYLILHGLSSNSSYLLNQESLSITFNMQSILSNLSDTIDSCEIHYKILFCLTEDDVAKTVHCVAQLYLSNNCEQDFTRAWLSSDISENEKFLLHFSCLNSFSAQLMLKYLSLEDIFKKSVEEMKEIIHEIPERVLMRLCQSVIEWKRLNDGLQESSGINSKTVSEKEKFVTANSCSSPTYSPLMSDQINETSPHRTLDLVNENMCKNIVSHSSSQQSQLHQYTKKYHYNDADEIVHSFHPWEQSYSDGRNNEFLEVLSQPHLIDNDNFETQYSCEDFFGKLSFENDEKARLNAISQERLNMNENKKFHSQKGCRNHSHSFMCPELNLHSDSTSSNKNFDYNSVEHSVTYNISQRNINNFNPEYKKLHSFHINSECSGSDRAFFNVEPHHNIFEDFIANNSSQIDHYKINKQSGNVKPPINNMSQTHCWTKSANSMEFRNQENCLFSPFQDMSDSFVNRGTNLTKPPVVNPTPPNFSWNEPNLFRANEYHKSQNNEMFDNSDYPWVKRNAHRNLVVSHRLENFHKSLGIVKPTSVNKHSIPYFDRFSNKHKYMPVQPVQPSLKGFVNDNFVASRHKQVQMSGPYYRTAAHNTELSQFNNSLTREVRQPEHKVKNALPYIPRQKVCVGLATPLRKQANEVSTVDSVCPQRMNTYTEAETSDSPPLDLVEDLNLLQSTQYTTNSAKLKRWNNHLLTISGHKGNDLRKTPTDNASSTDKPLLKRRKLQVVKKAGNNGQTVLAFK